MRAGRTTIRLLIGSGVVAGAIVLGAGAAGAAKPDKAAAGTGADAVVSSTSTTAKQAPSTTSTSTTPTTAAKAKATSTTSSTSTTSTSTTAVTVKPAAIPVRGPIIVTRPTSPGTDLTPTWTFLDPDGDPMTCTLTMGTTTVFGPSPCAGSVTYDLTGQPYGTYTLRVTSADQTVASSYTLLPAAPTITSAPASPGTDTTPTWSFTLPAGTSGRCSLLLGTTVVAGPVTCSGSQSFPITADGTYTFRVVAVTPDGITSAAATSTYTVDVTGPAAPTITSGPAAVSDDTTPTWTFTTGPGTASTECSLSRGTTVVSGPAPCSGSATYDLTLEPEGAYTFSVVAFDGAGNPSAAATSTYTLQALAPAPTPAITQSPTSPGTDTTPTWQFTTPAGTATECTLFQGSTVVVGPTACTSSFTPTLTADGTYTFQVVAIDTVTGARSLPATSSYTLDATPPAAPVFTSTPPAGSDDRTPTWTFTTPTGAVALECTLRSGTTVVAGPVDCSDGEYTANIRRNDEGTYTLSVVAIDAVGNRSAAATSTYTYDRTAPTAPVITSGPSGVTTNPRVTWTFTAPAGTTTTCSLTGPVNVSGACSGSASYDLSGLPDGTYTFSVVATDAAGNTSAAATRTITLDRTPPAAPTITGGPSGTSTDATPEWRFSVSGDVTTICSVLQGSVVVVGPVACSSPAAFDLSDLPAGTYTFSVVSVDQAGNVSPAATRSYTLAPSGSTPPPRTPPGRPPPVAPPPAPAPTPVVPPAAPGPVSPGPAPAGPAPSPDPRVAPRPAPPRPGGPAGPGGPPPASVIPPVRPPSNPPSNIIESAGRVVEEAAEGAAFPLLLVILVVLFLIIQNRIDRRDPKLAQAPVHAGEELEFRPPPSRRGSQ